MQNFCVIAFNKKKLEGLHATFLFEKKNIKKMRCLNYKEITFKMG